MTELGTALASSARSAGAPAGGAEPAHDLAVGEHSPDPLLQLRSLSVDVGPVEHPTRLVDRVDLAVGRGERVALVGESGSGKSVTARAVLRLDRHVRLSGSIRLLGREITQLPEKRLREVRGRQVGMVFQDPMRALNPLMTVGEQVVESLRLAGQRRRPAAARARELLGELGVPNAAARMGAYPHEFSGGMRQRVVLAIALAGNPSLLIADEPTTALDVRVQEQVLQLLRRVAEERQLGILLITHDLAIVASFAQRVAVMYSGRIVHADPVRPLFAAPAHPYTTGLLAAVPRLDVRRQRLAAIPGSPPQPDARPAGCAFHPRCAAALPRCSDEQPEPVGTVGGGTVACHLAPRPGQAPS